MKYSSAQLIESLIDGLSLDSGVVEDYYQGLADKHNTSYSNAENAGIATMDNLEEAFRLYPEDNQKCINPETCLNIWKGLIDEDILAFI